AFLMVKGAGPNRWQRYGERVLTITRKHRRHGAASSEPSSPISRHLSAAPPDDMPPDDMPPSDEDTGACGEPTVIHDSAAGPTGITPSSPDTTGEAVRLSHASPDGTDSAEAGADTFDTSSFRDPPIARDSAAPDAAPDYLAAPFFGDPPIARDSAATNVREPPVARYSAAARSAKVDGERVWQLCARGATLAQIAEQTRLPAADVARRLNDLRRAGRDLDVVHLLGAD